MKHMHTIYALLALVMVLTLTFTGTPAPTQAQTNERCFAETGYCISGSIRAYWEGNGGLPVFGYPISNVETATVEGWTGPVQWFERDRLEDHSANGQGVLAGRLGAFLLEQENRPWETLPQVESAPPGCAYFQETRHSLCEPFLSYWRTNGGLERFGYPITEPLEEEIGTWVGTVQYFERRRMEHHPENAGTPYEVLLGLLGRMLYDAVFFNVGGQIAFTSTRSGNQDIWVMDGDGSNAYNVTSNPDADDFHADWSPDGQQLVFVRGYEVTQNQDIWIIDSDGSNARQLSDNPTADWSPAWSPDGSRIAYVSDRNGKADIFIRNADGSGEDYNLTAFAPDTSEYAPAWSPDGSRIAYVSDEVGNPAIWVMTVDGSERYQLISDTSYVYNNPTWSPDGTRVLYDYRGSSVGAAASLGIGFIATDRSIQRSMADTYGGWHPTVSPTGMTMAYTNSGGDIVLANLDGSGTWNITDSPDALERDPAWYP